MTAKYRWEQDGQYIKCFVYRDGAYIYSGTYRSKATAIKLINQEVI